MNEFLQSLLGLGVEPKYLTFFQCSLRGIIVLIAAIIMVRLGSKRALAEKTVVDTLAVVIVASVLSRTINGPSPFFETIGTAFVMVLFHRLLMAGAFRWHWFGNLIKGKSEVIVEDGRTLRDVMKRNQVSEHDLEEDLRLTAKLENLTTIKLARIERSGDISFIKKEQ